MAGITCFGVIPHENSLGLIKDMLQSQYIRYGVRRDIKHRCRPPDRPRVSFNSFSLLDEFFFFPAGSYPGYPTPTTNTTEPADAEAGIEHSMGLGNIYTG